MNMMMWMRQELSFPPFFLVLLPTITVVSGSQLLPSMSGLLESSLGSAMESYNSIF
jgi:hypothetical protein